MPLSAGSAIKGATTDRTLNKLSYAFANVAADVGTAATGDMLIGVDVSADYEIKYFDAANIPEIITGQTIAALNITAPSVGGTAIDATGAEINRSCDASARIVTTTATTLGLTVTQHGERVVLINTNSTVANTFTLPAAAGTGVKFELVNNIVQTQGSVVIKAAGTDIFAGKAKAFDSTAVTAQAEIFLTSAISDTVTYNLTTTGGLGYDKFIAYDIAAGTWYVEVETTASGNCATPFSGT